MNATPRLDVPTTAAIAVVAYALANFIHEGVGHGGACLATGCSPELLTAVSFHSDQGALSAAAVRFIEAGGTLANLAAGLIALPFLRRAAADARWFFLWLFVTINLMQATGYLLFSGLGNVGDWAKVVSDLPGPGYWRAGLAAVGGLGYYWVTGQAMQRLASRIDRAGAARLPAVYRCTLTAYLAGAALYVTAGAFNPVGFELVLISACAASLGGTSGLTWGPQFLRDPQAGPYAGSALAIERDKRWIGAAVIVAATFVLALGPGIPLA